MFLKRKVIALALAFGLIMGCITPMETISTEASTGMTVFEFVKETMEAFPHSFVENISSIKTDLLGEYHVSADDAVYLAQAVQMGLIRPERFSNFYRDIKLCEAASIMVAAERLLYCNDPTIRTVFPAEEIDRVIEERISDAYRISSSEVREEFATAYMMGYISGESNGLYSDSRTCSPKKKPSSSELRSMIAMLTDRSLRSTLSPDWKVCRTDISDMPATACLYPYILDSYPNSYYETGFPADGVSTLAEGFKNWKPLSERISDTGREAYRANSSNFILPCEMTSFLNDDSGLGMGEEYKQLDTYFADEAAEYYRHLLNVDYRTIRNDEEWKEYMLRFRTEEYLDHYIDQCELNHTVIECDIAAADHSGVYYADNMYRCKVYVHMRVVNDDEAEIRTVDGLGYPVVTTAQLYIGANVTSLLPRRAGIASVRNEDLYLPRESIKGNIYTQPAKGEWFDHYVIALGCPLTEFGRIEVVGGTAMGTVERDYRYLVNYSVTDHFE